MKKTEKVLFVENLTQELKVAKSIVLINFAKMSVKTQQNLKKELKKIGAQMLVVKNSLFKRAGETLKLDPKILEDSILSGQTALIITSHDPIAPLTVLGRFAKEFDSGAGYSVPQLKVGIVENSFQDTQALIKLSNLPGKEALLGQLLGTLISPMSGLVSTLQSPMQKLVYILQQKGGD